MAEFNERYPFGKKATVVTADNISHAQMARAARQRIAMGRGTPEDIQFINEREQLIKKAVEE